MYRLGDPFCASRHQSAAASLALVQEEQEEEQGRQRWAERVGRAERAMRVRQEVQERERRERREGRTEREAQEAAHLPGTGLLEAQSLRCSLWLRVLVRLNRPRAQERAQA